MTDKLKKLTRLLKVHNQFVSWHLQNIGSLESSIRECEDQLRHALQSMDALLEFGIIKGPNFERIFREIALRKLQLREAVVAEGKRYRRANFVVEHLSQERRTTANLYEENALEQTLEELSSDVSNTSQPQGKCPIL